MSVFFDVDVIPTAADQTAARSCHNDVSVAGIDAAQHRL